MTTLHGPLCTPAHPCVRCQVREQAKWDAAMEWTVAILAVVVAVVLIVAKVWW